MKPTILLAVMILIFRSAGAQSPKAVSLKSILLSQLRSTYETKNWFVPIKVSLDGLTPEQVNWKDGSENHSIGQLASHLLFWNQRALQNFKGEKPEKFDGNNDETFKRLDKNEWDETLKKLDGVMTEMEKLVESADEAKLEAIAETISNVSTHNAYHTGQIIYIRKLQHSWNSEKGVK